MTTTTLESAVSLFGERTKGKLGNVGASGQPEDQLRSPFESLLQDMSVHISRTFIYISGVGLLGKSLTLVTERSGDLKRVSFASSLSLDS